MSSFSSTSAQEHTSDEAHRELDMDLDDALREAACALEWEGAQSSSSASHVGTSDIDPQHQFWPSSSTLNVTHSGSDAMWFTQGRTHQTPRSTAVDETPWLSRRNRRHCQRQSHVPYQPSPLSENNVTNERTDLIARNTLRELIFSALLSEDQTAPERAALLDDCRIQAEQSQLGVPFRELLSEPMEPLGIPPLLYEVMSCEPDWEGVNDDAAGTGMEVVMYLIEHWYENVLAHGKQGMLSWVVRAACLRRFDQDEANRLFQQLRPATFEKQHSSDKFIEFDVSLALLSEVSGAPGRSTKANEAPLDFNALISIPEFAAHIIHLRNTSFSGNVFEDEKQASGSGFHPQTLRPNRKPLPAVPAQARIGIEFLRSRRAWRLEVGDNALKLELLDGPDDDPGLYIDARVRVVSPASHSPDDINIHPSHNAPPIELLLPRALLRTISASGRGTHAVSLSPCFTHLTAEPGLPRGFDDPRYLHDGTLLMELTVRLSRTPIIPPPAPFSLPPKRATPNLSTPVPRSLSVAEVPVAGPSNSPEGLAAHLYPPAYQKGPTDESDDDLYIEDEEATLIERNVEDMDVASEDIDDWEKVDEMDETEEKDSGWVKASYIGQDEDL